MRAIARWVMVSVVLQGTAWAQESRVPTMQEICERYKDAPGMRGGACAAYLPPESEPVSRALGIVGVLTTVVGTSLVLHWGFDDVRVLGDTYCVGSYSVDAGSCGSAMETKVGLAMIGSGVLMTWLGLRSKTVSVAPSVSHTAKGVTAKVVW